MTLWPPLRRVLTWRARAFSARRDALVGQHRWRMIFEQSPVARVCFDAARLHDFLRARAPSPDMPLGEVLKAELTSVADIFALVAVVEGNQVAAELCGEDLAGANFSEGYLEAFADALNSIGEDGALPVFAAELTCADERRVEVEAHYRMATGGGPPWSLCLATYVDVTKARQAARAQQEALEAAEGANRAKSDFLAVMSHEIRTPLNGVMGMAQVMAADRLSDVQRKRLGVIRDSGAALLEIVDELCEAMASGLSAQGEPDVDGSLAVDLPTAPRPPPAGPDHAVRILAAEDNPVNQLVLKALLAQLGVEPTIVENGADAVQAWEDGPWDVILMDVQMPVMDGPTASRAIRAREAATGRPATPILAVTANAMTHQIASYRAAGMDDVISKPINVDDLFGAIVRALAEPESGAGPYAVTELSGAA